VSKASESLPIQQLILSQAQLASHVQRREIQSTIQLRSPHRNVALRSPVIKLQTRKLSSSGSIRGLIAPPTFPPTPSDPVPLSDPHLSITCETAATLSDSQEESHGESLSAGLPQTAIEQANAPYKSEVQVGIEVGVELDHDNGQDISGNPNRARSPPPRYPYPSSEASASTSFSRPEPPPFSSLYAYNPVENLADDDHFELPSPGARAFSEAGASSATAAPAYAPAGSTSSDDHPFENSPSFQDAVTETKNALPKDVKGESSGQKVDDPSEPPPAYSEGYSPLLSFTYLMAAAGGAASIITQVQQGGPPVNTIGGEISIMCRPRPFIADTDLATQMLAPMRPLRWT
jgi:hypothetical protein